MKWLLWLVLSLAASADQVRRVFPVSQGDPARILRIVQAEYPDLSLARTSRGISARGQETLVNHLAGRWAQLDRQDPMERVFIQVTYADPEGTAEICRQCIPELQYEPTGKGFWCTGTAGALNQLAELGVGHGSWETWLDFKEVWSRFSSVRECEVLAVSYFRDTHWFAPRPLLRAGRWATRWATSQTVKLGPEPCQQVLAAVWQDVVLGEGTNMCFEPHHALRLNWEGHTYVVLICYECGRVQVWQDGAKLGEHATAGGAHQLLNRYLNSTTPAPAAPAP